jgi:hypothetical protein
MTSVLWILYTHTGHVHIAIVTGMVSANIRHRRTCFATNMIINRGWKRTRKNALAKCILSLQRSREMSRDETCRLTLFSLFICKHAEEEDDALTVDVGRHGNVFAAAIGASAVVGWGLHKA